jgi:hypothetical protein
VGRRSAGAGVYGFDVLAGGQGRFEGDAHGSHEPKGVDHPRGRAARLGWNQAAHAADFERPSADVPFDHEG